MRKKTEITYYSDEYPNIPFKPWSHRKTTFEYNTNGIWMDSPSPTWAKNFCLGTIYFHEDFGKDSWERCWRGSEYKIQVNKSIYAKNPNPHSELGWHSGPIFYTLTEVRDYILQNAKCRDLQYYLWGVERDVEDQEWPDEIDEWGQW
jgi:hypothetical protein